MATKTSLSFNIRFDQPVKVWVLQLGGWLPAQLTGVGVVLVDRNVVSALSALADHPDRTDMDAERWWLAHLDSERFVLNPVLCASEGGFRGVPTFQEFCDGLAEASEILVKGLPKARLIQHDRAHFDRLYDNVTAAASRQEGETAFLSDVARLIASRVSAGSDRKVEATIIEAARTAGLLLHSFAVLAVLSCLYEPQDGNEPLIGRGVVKPTTTYSAADAHNTLADLRSLEFLAATSSLQGPTPGFCTRDKDLAAFWSGLGVSAPTWTGRTFSADLAPTLQLFPRLDEEALADLFTRLR